MDIAALKLDLIRQILAINDEETLRRVSRFFDQLELEGVSNDTVSEGAVAYGITEPEDELTEQDLEELEKRRADRLSGKSVGLPMEESLRQLRSTQARDEAV